MTLGRWSRPFKERAQRVWERHNPFPFTQNYDESWPRWVKMKIINMHLQLFNTQWIKELDKCNDPDSDSD
jgi:hypothetical protein